MSGQIVSVECAFAQSAISSYTIKKIKENGTYSYLSFSIKRAPSCARTVDANTARTSNLSNLKFEK